MDGFNVIPIDKENFKDVIPSSGRSGSQTVASGFDSNVEIIDESKKTQVVSANGSSFFYLLSILSLLGVFMYFAFLVFQRFNYLSQITTYGEQLKILSAGIDKKELEDFKVMDQTLKAINAKLGKHVLNSQVFLFVNKNIRTNLQVVDYRVDVKEKDVEVNLTAVAPTFKDFAEQTEKLFTLKTQGSIKSFSVSGLAFESDTRRLRFSTKIVFDRTAVSALTLANGNN